METQFRKIIFFAPIISALAVFVVDNFYFNHFLFDYFLAGLAISLAAGIVASFLLKDIKNIKSVWLFIPLHIITTIASVVVIVFILFVTLLSSYGF